MPLLGNSQCDSITIFKVRWCISKDVSIPCPDAIVGCLVFHAKTETECFDKRFTNYNKAKDFYKKKRVNLPEYSIELKIYGIKLDDLFSIE